ncbi:accessory factor UbiK family protein [Halomonas sp. HMF6819]|uniref:accessory factor UbiK family protein n=1 Tax=unclassified Halomonas TaxID=2609666 RepID=UPI002076A805|nr:MULTISPECIES: accessory factor UbiK family protein [unclassified Halomonas]
MATQDRISRLAQQIGDRLQNASHAPEDIQKGVQQVMRGAFDRMELVSREDFDILMDVLQRTRSRVEALERQVANLEASIDASQIDKATPMEAEAQATPAPEEPVKKAAKPRATATKPAKDSKGATGAVDDLGE